MAKDKVELDALSAMGFSVGCQVIAMKEAITTQLGLSPEQLEAFNAEYDKTYLSEMEVLLEELEEEGPAVATLLREMISQKGGEPEQSPMETEASLQAKIEAACASVVAERPCLLTRELHERTITGRIAYYLQPLIGDAYFVDCEYNKMTDGLSGDTLKKLSEYDTDSVIPDIIIHDRKKDASGNLAVIEAKWNGSNATLERERDKISLYLTQPELKYEFGFLMVLKKNSISVTPVIKR